MQEIWTIVQKTYWFWLWIDKDDYHLESMYISNHLYAHLPRIHRQISIVLVCKQQSWLDIDLWEIEIVEQLVSQATNQRIKYRIEIPLILSILLLWSFSKEWIYEVIYWIYHKGNKFDLQYRLRDVKWDIQEVSKNQ
jgi:hypothetical protein